MAAATGPFTYAFGVAPVPASVNTTPPTNTRRRWLLKSLMNSAPLALYARPVGKKNEAPPSAGPSAAPCRALLPASVDTARVRRSKLRIKLLNWSLKATAAPEGASARPRGALSAAQPPTPSAACTAAWMLTPARLPATVRTLQASALATLPVGEGDALHVPVEEGEAAPAAEGEPLPEGVAVGEPLPEDVREGAGGGVPVALGVGCGVGVGEQEGVGGGVPVALGVGSGVGVGEREGDGGGEPVALGVGCGVGVGEPMQLTSVTSPAAPLAPASAAGPTPTAETL